jgi:hypothetical protein
MTKLSEETESVAKRLLETDPEKLYEEIAIRTETILKDPTTAGSFAKIQPDGQQMGVMRDALQDLGKRIFQRWNVEARNLFCGTDPNTQKNKAELKKAFGVSGDVQVAVVASMTTLLVMNFSIAPAIAAAIAALIVKLFFRPAYEEFCKFWGEHIKA